MAEDEITGYIESIRIQKKKEISVAYDKSKKIFQSVIKNSEKMKEGCKRLVEETESQLTEEGVKKMGWASKVRSFKAINALAHYIDDQLVDFQVPNSSQKLTSSELSQFIRVLSRLMNEISREQGTTDSIMGLDFMIKKRAIYVPLSKMKSDLASLRNLQKEEYQIIKTLEDLHGLSTDVKNISEKISITEEEINNLQVSSKKQKEIKNETEKQLTLYQEDPLIKESRKRGIRMTELEIEIGRHLNSFKKVFKKYAREIQRGSISGEFGLVNTALAYEDDPVHRFLDEDEGNPEIIALFEELIKVGKVDLHLKQKHINNLRQELNNLSQGKMDSWKKEWHNLLATKAKEENGSEFKSINNKLLECENEIQTLKDKIRNLQEEIDLKNKERNQLTESLSERHQRANTLLTKVLENQK
ncbi:MAG: hypothetical protein JSV04_00940 [Candidatus Heimdallarchaeota archaeon]|nr:MAG: hypothetical protein JSV04_00940 [Candidatus Heimdallarchaeota archaeon]